MDVGLKWSQIPIYIAEIDFLWGGKGGWFLTVTPKEKTDFDSVTENLIFNLSLIYWKMNRGLHDIPQSRLSDT